MGTPVDKICYANVGKARISMDKVCCIIYHTGDNYKKIALNAISSFKKYHPDIRLFEVSDDNLSDYSFSKNIKFSIAGIETEIDIGARKYFIAVELMKYHGYEKVICLGADTITTARLTEFIDSKAGIAITCDYPDAVGFPWEESGSLKRIEPGLLSKVATFPKEAIEAFHNMYEECYINNTLPHDIVYANADVICFNSLGMLEDICAIWHKYRGITLHPKYKYRIAHELNLYDVDLSQKEVDAIRDKLLEIKSPNATATTAPGYHYLSEQAALNIFVAKWVKTEGIIEIVDLPLLNKGVYYNVRSKGTPTHSNKNLKDFYVKDGKLLNHTHNQIKVWHYCASLSSNPQGFNTALQKINESFSDEVRQYFADNCDCENYFNV